MESSDWQTKPTLDSLRQYQTLWEFDFGIVSLERIY